MTLKKELCIKCREKASIWKDCSVIGWTERDDERWEYGIIRCPFIYRDRSETVGRWITEPPIKCPYYLENIL